MRRTSDTELDEDLDVLDVLLAEAVSVASDAERFALIRRAWLCHLEQGEQWFDWDYDSRPLMRVLTGTDG